MASELVYQKYLIDAAIELGGEGIKLSNRFLVGVVDLLIQLPTRPTILLEVKKWDRLPRQLDKKVVSGLTPLQSQFLLDWSRAGAVTGWLAIWREGTTDYLYADHDPKRNPSVAEIRANCTERKRGTQWTEALVSAIGPLYQIS